MYIKILSIKINKKKVSNWLIKRIILLAIKKYVYSY